MKHANENNKQAGTFYGLIVLIGIVLVAVCSATLFAADSDLSWNGYSDVSMRINIWHDEDDEVYSKGENIRAHFETNKDAYAVVYRIDSEGEVTILWPRNRHDDGFVYSEHTYNLPAPGAPRIRAGAENGVEYIEAILSAYPFDLRELQVDFHHENLNVEWDYYVAGDPFLAINEVNFAVTGLEDPEDFIVTNYTSYYVGREVDHPRYLCSQCHDVNQYHPYRDNCNINVHYDYGWDNDWFVSYGFYPAYYYPVYYYVDPWTSRPWVNYWYNPWYYWPSSGYNWGWDYYAWNYSPYWNGGVSVLYKTGDRRYRPISKSVRYDKTGTDRLSRIPKKMMKDGRPSSVMKDKMERRLVNSKAVKSRENSLGYKNTVRDIRHQAPISRVNSSPVSTPGIRVPDRVQTTSGSAVKVRGNSSSIRTNSNDEQRYIRSSSGMDNSKRPVIKPVEPRTRGDRIWNGSSTKQKPKSRSNTSSRSPTVKSNDVKKSPKSSVNNSKSSTPRSQPSSVRSKSSSKSGSSSRSKSTSKSSGNESRTGKRSR
jgi:hypothetical protein